MMAADLDSTPVVSTGSSKTEQMLKELIRVSLNLVSARVIIFLEAEPQLTQHPTPPGQKSFRQM